MISEDMAGIIAGAAVGIGWVSKHLMSKLGDETKRGENAIIRSLRGEIGRLSDLVSDLSERLDEEIRKRQQVEESLARYRGKVVGLEEQVRRLGGRHD